MNYYVHYWTNLKTKVRFGGIFEMASHAANYARLLKQQGYLVSIDEVNSPAPYVIQKPKELKFYIRSTDK